MRSIGVALLIASAGCGRLHFDPLGGDGAPGGDAPGDGAPACSTFGPWSAPVQVPNVNSALQDAGPALSADMTELYFHTNRANVSYEIYVARRATRNDDFGAPQLVPTLTGPNDVTNPTLSSDGLVMYLNIRPGNNNLYKATRATVADDFGTPVLVTELAAIGLQGPALNASGDELYYSIGPGGSEHLEHAVLDASQTWTVVGPIPEFAGIANAAFPTLGAGDTLLAFEGSQSISGPVYVYGATRQGDGSFTAIAPIDEINAGGTGAENDPEISRDGTTMVFGSGRPGSQNLDLYMSTRSCQ